MENELLTIKRETEKVLSLLDCEAKVLVRKRDEAVLVDIEMSSPGLLIGTEGEGLWSLQNILRLLVDKKLPETGRLLVLDINGYRQRWLDRIKHQVEKAISRVVHTQKEEKLPPMNAFERRFVHQFVNSVHGVKSESINEGFNRCVVIKPV